MGASGKWLKSLITLKKLPPNDHEKMGDKSKKRWRLWRSSSEGFGSSMKSSTKRSEDDAFTAAMAAVVRAPPKDFMIIKQEWAAIRIQTVFRGFLARRALRALKAVVRIQAIFRGRQVRRQAVVTLKCMQALVRVQARARARSVRMSPEGQAFQKLLDENRDQSDPIKRAEEGWCDSPGTVTQVREKLHLRKNGAIKRERAMAYSLTQQKLRGNASPKSTKSQPPAQKNWLDKNNNSGWSWLERWMASKPWENRLMEDSTTTPSSETTPFSKKTKDFSCSFEQQDSVRVRKNNVTTRISARPYNNNTTTVLNQPARCSSSSSPNCESLCDESSACASTSTSASPTLVSNSNKMESLEETNLRIPSYMNPTQSIKAKQRGCSNFWSQNMQRFSVEGFQFHYKSMELSNNGGDDTRSSAGSNPSINFRNELYPPMSKGRNDCLRYKRR